MRREERLVKGVIEEDRAAHTHAPSKSLEVVLGALVGMIPVDRDHVDLTSIDFDRARIAYQQIHLQAQALAGSGKLLVVRAAMSVPAESRFLFAEIDRPEPIVAVRRQSGGHGDRAATLVAPDLDDPARTHPAEEPEYIGDLAHRHR